MWLVEYLDPDENETTTAWFDSLTHAAHWTIDQDIDHTTVTIRYVKG
jgi:hypothetical protein